VLKTFEARSVSASRRRDESLHENASRWVSRACEDHRGEPSGVSVA
jgi:hypothetical protein